MTARQYRKKPVVIEAILWNGINFDDLILWGAPVRYLNKTDGLLIVATLEDGPQNQVKHIASLGDYIIRGVAGEFYPCKPEIFNQTYEERD